MNFYNEIDPYAAQFLRNLIAAGLIPAGVVDTRPIQEIESWELLCYTQCHFFCGIGVWPLALRQAGWSEDEPIWTGSCPCQPFSQAGKQKGFSDDRHLWPYWFNLIAQCRPSRIAGEQVASALEWLDLVSGDLEKAGYAFGAADLCAAGFGGAHIRQRNYFVGLADDVRNGAGSIAGNGDIPQSEIVRIDGDTSRPGLTSRNGSAISRLADDDDTGLERRIGMSECGNQRPVGSSGLAGGLGKSHDARLFTGLQGGKATRQRHTLDATGSINPNSAIHHPRQARSFENVDWLLCRKPVGEPSWRPVEPGTFPLAHGVASRVGKLRAYGNALDAKTATAFCEAIVEIVGIRPMSYLQEYDL